jgi:hypothetical protein
MTKYFETIDEHTKHLIDGVSVATVMGTLMSWWCRVMLASEGYFLVVKVIINSFRGFGLRG